MTYFVYGKGTKPEIIIKTSNFNNIVYVDTGQDISIDDWLLATSYILTNSDLNDENDPRLQFLEYAKSLRLTKGFTRYKRLKEGKIKRMEKIFGEINV